VSIQSRHPELDSGSIHRGKEGSPLTPTLSRRARGKRVAFTLAEVLITLAIIGVVAAMTIPTLMTNFQKKVTAVKARKVYAELTQAVQLSQIDNGPVSTWNFGVGGSDGDLNGSVENTRVVLNKYLVPYFSGIRECSVGINYECGVPMSKSGINYELNNGNYLSCVSKAADKQILCVSTVNNKGEKSVSGKDWFYFAIANNRVTPYGWYDGITREDVIAGVDVPTVDIKFLVACRNNKSEDLSDEYYLEDERAGCTALLMLDNWEFKDDYPWN